MKKHVSKNLKGRPTTHNLQLWKEGVPADYGKEDCGKIVVERVNVEAWFERVQRKPHNPQPAIMEGRNSRRLEKGILWKG